MGMKPILIAACIAGFWISPSASPGQAGCPATVQAGVEVASGEFSLADLLTRDSCPALLRAAAGVRLGSAPSAGSVRVLAGDDVRARLQKLAAGEEDRAGGSSTLRVPQRIMVRRTGARASCADLAHGLALPGTAPLSTTPEFADPLKTSAVSGREIDCGAADRIPQGTELERTRTVWDGALGSWNVFARCVHPADCVPFLVRLPSLPSEIALSAGPFKSMDAGRSLAPSSAGRPAPERAAGKPLVRAGETVSLLWDQDGIRLTVPAVALDAGGPGQGVRARIGRGGRMVRAIVVSAGKLRSAS